MSAVLLVQGETRALPLTAGSVHCVVTSPPYYSLRDYQTGRWVGGDGSCAHRRLGTRDTRQRAGLTGGLATINIAQEPQWKRTCGDCGAVRVDAQIGLEDRADCNGAFTGVACGACWVCAMRAVFKEVSRVLRPDGTLWINCGDSYARTGAAPPRRDHSGGQGLGTYGQQGYTAACAMPARPRGPLPEKNLLGLPWRLALALQADGFILRSEIIWHKVNPMPESVGDRPVRSHEQIFLFSKQAKYYYDGEAVRESNSAGSIERFGLTAAGQTRPWHTEHNKRDGIDDRIKSTINFRAYVPYGRACRSVWSLASEPTPYAHFATFGTELVHRCLLAGCPREVCSACGKPWVRTIETSYTRHSRMGYMGKRIELSGEKVTPMAGMPRMDKHVTTTGFAPTCACTAPTRPGLVLDPFCGSGTTLLVARELGLHAVGVDLSLPYLRDIARERLGLAALHRWTNGSTPPPVSYTDLPLFAEDAP